jgi:hypothetical protein
MRAGRINHRRHFLDIVWQYDAGDGSLGFGDANGSID